MSSEAALYAAMAAQVAPVPVYRLAAPQLSDEQPDNVPYIVFSRESYSEGGLENFCAADSALADSYIVDCYDVSYSGARELSRNMTAVFRAFHSAVDSVFEDFEAGTRIYRISSSYTLRP